MKWLGNSKWPIPKGPVRATVITFLVLSALFGITAPFMPDIPRLTYFLGGVGYSAFLAILGVGICLRGPTAGKQLKVIMLLCLIVCLSVYLPLVYGMLTQDLSPALAVSGIANRIGLWLCSGMIAFMVFISAFGWKQHWQKTGTPNQVSDATSEPANPS